MAGRSVVSDDFFNQKTLTKNILPVRNGYCLDLITLEKGNVRKKIISHLNMMQTLRRKRKTLKGFFVNSVQRKIKTLTPI
jgi:hypothetical protein